MYYDEDCSVIVVVDRMSVTKSTSSMHKNHKKIPSLGIKVVAP